MPVTVTKEVVATGNYNQFVLSAGASKMAAVKLPHDDDATHIESPTANEKQSFTVQPLPASAVAVTSVTLRCRARQGSGSGNLRLFIRVSGADTFGGSQGTGSSFFDYSDTLVPSGGWTVAKWNAAEIGVEQLTTLANLRVTTLYADVVYLIETTIPQHRHIATYKLLQKTWDDHRHSLEIPLWLALKLELLDPFNASHDSLLRSRTHLEGITSIGISPFVPESVADHQLFDRWRRQLVDLVSVSVDYGSRTAILEFQDSEMFLASYFCSEKVIGATADHYPGLAEMDVGGGVLTNERSSVGHVIQESNIVTTQSRGTFVGTVSPNIAKRNHLGLLCEDASENIVVRAVFDQGLTSYTTTLNSGTITAGTTRKYFDDGIASQSIAVSRPNNSADTYVSPASALSVAAGDGHRRMAIIYSGRGSGHIASWALQRASDSNWWNDSSGAWQVGFVWNNLPDTWDATNSLEIASYFQSKAIPTTTTTWTFRLGLNAAAIPAGGATVDFGYVGLHKGKRRFSPIPTFGSAVTTAVDTVKNVLDVDPSDPVRQLWWAGHGTMEVVYQAEQDVADLVDPSKHTIIYVQYGTSGKDYDALIYERPAFGAGLGGFRYERWRDIAGTSTFDSVALNDYDLVRGAVKSITCRNIGTDQELGLAAKTMLIRFDFGFGQINGFPAVATAQHSQSEKHTEVWIGCAPTTGPTAAYSRAMGYISDVRLNPRVLTDEECRP